MPENSLRATCLLSLFRALIAAGGIWREIHEGIGLEHKEIGCNDEELKQVDLIITHSSISSTKPWWLVKKFVITCLL